jgi:hypothetical protein
MAIQTLQDVRHAGNLANFPKWGKPARSIAQSQAHWMSGAVGNRRLYLGFIKREISPSKPVIRHKMLRYGPDGTSMGESL